MKCVAKRKQHMINTVAGTYTDAIKTFTHEEPASALTFYHLVLPNWFYHLVLPPSSVGSCTWFYHLVLSNWFYHLVLPPGSTKLVLPPSSTT
ncbi:hypothetical protein CTAM01_17335 [Colletotrichum tamarilloi]|uniref:Uncharacterized protein n=1 Tax=Colletotrichum tamarilloi TaxID=1209934 RepID=A0ABQ9QGD0_9PEZI|nr:uncharacterized protein CTAM01_17335 [Colletotrichum tamarilloi]KAK1448511.1 hypothetical protein CTAM01_17335 [Colletotrichum tamarilloi]